MRDGERGLKIMVVLHVGHVNSLGEKKKRRHPQEHPELCRPRTDVKGGGSQSLLVGKGRLALGGKTSQQGGARSYLYRGADEG